MFTDLNAPRFNKRKYRYNIVSKQLYNTWKSGTGSTISFIQFKHIWANIADTIVDKVLTERDGIRLGTGVGDIYIGIVPTTKKRAIDYKLSKELNKIVYHENWSTNGKLGKIIYATNDRPYIFKLNRYWGFIPHTNFKDQCTKALLNNPEVYKNTLEGKYPE